MSAHHPGPGDKVDFGLWHDDHQTVRDALSRALRDDHTAPPTTGGPCAQPRPPHQPPDPKEVTS